LKRRERKLWLPNDRAWKNILTPNDLNVVPQSSIEHDLTRIKHIYYDKVHKKNPVFAERVEVHKKLRRDSSGSRKHALMHKLKEKLRRQKEGHVYSRRHSSSKLHHTHKSKDLIQKHNKRKLKRKHDKKHKKKQKKRKHKKKKQKKKKRKHIKRNKKRKLKVDISKKKREKKRELSGPKATPNVAVDDTRVQIRTFTRLPKQSPIINNALSTGTQIIQPRIRLPSNHITNKH
jgi:hypothetical protein